ncbi:MAG: hypothetical protein HUU34_12375 [Saprospiraceae bacterium]|nr:hypothetical protein [Saprospiraceae bacterium]
MKNLNILIAILTVVHLTSCKSEGEVYTATRCISNSLGLCSESSEIKKWVNYYGFPRMIEILIKESDVTKYTVRSSSDDKQILVLDVSQNGKVLNFAIDETTYPMISNGLTSSASIEVTSTDELELYSIDPGKDNPALKKTSYSKVGQLFFNITFSEGCSIGWVLEKGEIKYDNTKSLHMTEDE